MVTKNAVFMRSVAFRKRLCIFISARLIKSVEEKIFNTFLFSGYLPQFLVWDNQNSKQIALPIYYYKGGIKRWKEMNLLKVLAKYLQIAIV